jgi:DUF1680 family protein
MNRRDSLKLLLIATGNALLCPDRLLAQSSAKTSAIAPVFTNLTLGEIKPSGWVKEQMLRDLHQGFAGHLDQLCPEASSDIFVTHRNTAKVENTSNVEKNNWWNGETEGNWRAGFITLAYLSEDQPTMRQADDYVRHILASQDKDGYMGVFAPDLRFSKGGELWTQACLFRGLLDYAELTGDPRARDAVKRAIDLDIAQYSNGNKTALGIGVGGGGASHDLMISDVAERLYEQTGDPKYRDFILSLYNQVNVTASQADTALPNLLNLDAGWSEHGANTYETLRVPLWLWMATGREDLGRASRNSLEKLDRYTEPSGSAVSQENISLRKPDPTFTEYEYCGTKEIQFTLESALQKTGVASLGDKIERLWFNAAQAGRLADGTAITYLTPENRLNCDGMSQDGKVKELRNKFSPTHTDVAVCCNPNAAIVSGLYVRAMWMRHANGGLAAVLYGPCKVSTTVHNVPVHIEEKTNYPFDHTVDIVIQPARGIEFPVLLRDPEWSSGTTVTCDGASITRNGDYWTVTRNWRAGDQIRIQFVPSIRERPAVNGEIALQYGSLVFAQPIESTKKVIKSYSLSGFEDAHFIPVGEPGTLALPSAMRWQSFGFKPVTVTENADPLRPFDKPLLLLEGKMTSPADGSEVAVALVPLGNAPILRRVTFPVVP